MAKECRFRSAALFSSHLFGPSGQLCSECTCSPLQYSLCASLCFIFTFLFDFVDVVHPAHPRAATTLVSRGVQLAVSRDSRGTPAAPATAHAPRDGPDGRSSVHDPGLDSARADRVTVP